MKSARNIKTDLKVEFFALATEIERLASQWNVTIAPSDPALKIFRSLSYKRQQAVLQNLRNQLDFFTYAQAQNMPADHPQLVWRAMKRLGFTPEADVFDKISSENVVEIYNMDATACFRNLTFFKYVSMTLEEIYGLTLYESVHLPTKAYAYFFEMFIRFKLGLVRGTFRPLVTNYELLEKCGRHLRIEVDLQWLSPLKRDGKTEACLAINHARNLFA